MKKNRFYNVLYALISLYMCLVIVGAVWQAIFTVFPEVWKVRAMLSPIACFFFDLLYFSALAGCLLSLPWVFVFVCHLCKCVFIFMRNLRESRGE